MSCRRIATEGSRVQYTDGSGDRSSINMHSRADAAGVIVDTSSSNAGGWHYVSNSEVGSGDGGVGTKLLFRNVTGGVNGWACEVVVEGQGDTSVASADTGFTS